MKKVGFLLVVLLTAAVGLQGQVLREFIIREENKPSSIPVFPQFPRDAAVIIYSGIPNLVFESNTDGIVADRSVPGENKYVLIVRTETQTLTIKGPGYIETKLRVPKMSMREARFYSIEAKIPSMDPETGDLIIRTVPAGAKIEIDSLPSFSAFTPYTLTGIQARTWSIRLTRTDYDTVRISIPVRQGETISKVVELTPRFGLMKLNSDAENEVELNGKWMAWQPDEPIRIPVGVNRLRVFREYYLPQEQLIEMGPGDDPEMAMVVPVNLVPDYGEWDIRLEPDGSSVFVDGKEVFPTGGYLKVPSGKHQIRVFHPGYEDSVWIQTVRRLEERDVRVSLRRSVGKLQVTSDPDEAEVWLGDSLIGYTPFFSEHIPTGLYQLSIRKETYRQVDFPISIKKSELINREAMLYRQARLTVTGTPGARFRVVSMSNHEIDLDESMPAYQLKLPPGNYSLIFDNPGYEPERFTFSADEEDIEYRVNLIRTDGRFFRFALFGNNRLMELYQRRKTIAIGFRKSGFSSEVMRKIAGFDGGAFPVDGLDFVLSSEGVPFRTFYGYGINDKKSYFVPYTYRDGTGQVATGLFRYETVFAGLSVTPFMLAERIAPSLVLRYEFTMIYYKPEGTAKSKKLTTDGFSLGYEIQMNLDNTGVTPVIRFTYNPMSGESDMRPQTTVHIGILL